ncbi:MAG: glycine cleavage system protein GcvH [Acidobacteria bacterium]|nr:glycine cleavage system protein GcvH [Acidobacteriota bacterium]
MIPEDRLYTEQHEWLKLEDGEAVLGITDFAQQELGDVVFVEMPAAGQEFEAGLEIGAIESVKAVAEIYTPVGGTVKETNSQLEDTPELVNEDPYGEGWLVRLQLSGEGPEDLMTASEYESLLAAG